MNLLLDQSVEPLLPAAYCLLRCLGITESYKGFRYAAYAAALASLDQERLLLVTKRLYPDVARHFGTTWQAVERDLRTVIAVAWKRNPALLDDLAQEHLEHKPACARFLASLSRCLTPSAQLHSLNSMSALHEPIPVSLPAMNSCGGPEFPSPGLRAILRLLFSGSDTTLK